MSLAREALRDGLWEIARQAVGTNASDDAKLIVLESYANEGRWAEIRKVLAGWPGITGSAFDYYRAAADNDRAKAKEILAKTDSSSALLAAKMIEADLLVKANDAQAAAALWQEVAASSNAEERAFVLACVNLGKSELLRQAYARAKSVRLRRLAGLRLGIALVRAEPTYEEGVRLLRALVRDAPDENGAQEAFLSIADVALEKGLWKDADAIYHEAIETWPEAAKLFRVQEGRARSFAKTGQADKAIECYRRAEEVANNDNDRAISILRQGDVFSEQGRGNEALVCYRKVLARFPATEVAIRLKRIIEIRDLEAKGMDLYREYRFADAQKTFAEVAQLDPSRQPRIDYMDVLCLYGQGLDDRAEFKARQVTETAADPKIKAAMMLWLAKFLFNRGNWKESQRLFVTYSEQATDAESVSEALLWATRAAFADHNYGQAIRAATSLSERYPEKTAMLSQALLVQAEALVELARFDEAVLVLDRLISFKENVFASDRIKAQLLRADALFAMGADNPARYQSAVKAYRDIRFGADISPDLKIVLSFKIARALEKLKRVDEAMKLYYAEVIIAYRDGRLRGEHYDDETRAAFSRAAFRFADENESRGRDAQAMRVLELVAESDVPAAEEALRRIDRISRKGRFL